MLQNLNFVQAACWVLSCGLVRGEPARRNLRRHVFESSCAVRVDRVLTRLQRLMVGGASRLNVMLELRVFLLQDSGVWGWTRRLQSRVELNRVIIVKLLELNIL